MHSVQDVADLLALGEQQKRRAATAMNDRSSRAHSIFIMSLKQRKAKVSYDGPQEVSLMIVFLASFMADCFNAIIILLFLHLLLIVFKKC